jgi:hypothetical protein
MKINIPIIKLLSAISLLFSIQAAHSQTNAPITTIMNHTGCPVTTVVIPVTVKRIANITAANLHIEYDPAQLSFIGSCRNFQLPNILFNTESVGGSSTLNTAIVEWADSLHQTLPVNDTLALLTFNYLSGAATLAFNKASNYVSNCEYEDVNTEPMMNTTTGAYYINGKVSLNSLATNPFPTDALAMYDLNYFDYTSSSKSFRAVRTF